MLYNGKQLVQCSYRTISQQLETRFALSGFINDAENLKNECYKNEIHLIASDNNWAEFCWWTAIRNYVPHCIIALNSTHKVLDLCTILLQTQSFSFAESAPITSWSHSDNYSDNYSLWLRSTWNFKLFIRIFLKTSFNCSSSRALSWSYHYSFISIYIYIYIYI